MYLGIDLGTSGVKVVLMDAEQTLLATSTQPLVTRRPRPDWSEQDPEDWWRAVDLAMCQLRNQQGKQMRAVEAIGLSGQMHGATLLDVRDRVLRPAILWNDGRSAAECALLLQRVPNLLGITGNLAMPGFTAPKLLWVARQEPALFSQVARVLLPKDYVRLRMTGSYATDASDASGTLWLDVGGRQWSQAMLDACELSMSQMPTLHEGPAITGVVSAEHAQRWGLKRRVRVAAGAGDNAASAIGMGVVNPGDGFISLGTSGVSFVCQERFMPNAEQALHTFCHALPRVWHQMAVTLSAANCVDWCARLCGMPTTTAMLWKVTSASPKQVPIFLPYLSGERTPHNDPNARGVFFGLTHDTDRAALGRAVLEGIAFSIADGQRLLPRRANDPPMLMVGGGARCELLVQILASVTGQTLAVAEGFDVGAALGAARLAMLCVRAGSVKNVCARPSAVRHVEPDPHLRDQLLPRYAQFQSLYPALKHQWTPHATEHA